MKKDFFQYIEQEFEFSKQELKDFEASCFLPLKKSIRVNINKISIEDFKKLSKKNNWILTETNLWKNTFYIDRFDDLDLALWNTQEHQKGFFYVQELAASSSPFYMSWDKIDEKEYLILDMSASPWWKTTQLAEYYPNSLIVANEVNKERFKWLFLNLDRMWALNVVCTNYDWRFFKNNIELFDKVLLDAPCSWEWTAYKTEDSLKFRNIKNIKSISKLQTSLLDSAIRTLKVWWEIVYSTCTLNKIENEWVIETILNRYKNSLEIVYLSKNNKFIPYVRNWPHIDKTWGFFVVKIKKTKSIQERQEPEKYSRESLFDVKLERKKKKIHHNKDVIQNFEKLASKASKNIEKYIDENFDYLIKYKKFYKFKDEIYMINKDISELAKKLFFYKIWVNIGKYKNNDFIANEYLENLR